MLCVQALVLAPETRRADGVAISSKQGLEASVGDAGVPWSARGVA
jgi:hypothetical protein